MMVLVVCRVGVVDESLDVENIRRGGMVLIEKMEVVVIVMGLFFVFVVIIVIFVG